MPVGDKQIFVGRFKSKAEREAEKKKLYETRRLDRLQKTQGVNLYVKNLDDTIDDLKLRESFSKFGNITSAKVYMPIKLIMMFVGSYSSNTCCR